MNPMEIRQSIKAVEKDIEREKATGEEKVQALRGIIQQLKEQLPPPVVHQRRLNSSYYYNGRMDPEELPAGMTLDERPARCGMCGNRPPLYVIYPNWIKQLMGRECTDYSWARECQYCDDLMGLF